MQPGPPQTRQSKPPAKPAPKDALHDLAPGGPIKPTQQGFENPGPTKNLRGVEPNTSMHRGEPNPEQSGTPGHIGGADHNPGMAQAGMDHAGPTQMVHPKGRTAEHSQKHPSPPPDPRGVRK